MKKIALIAALLGAAAAEVSVFEAGNLNVSNPYGLTDSEKSQLQNRQRVESISSDVSVAKENIEGLRSILDSLNETNQRTATRISDLENSATATTTELKDELKKLSDEVAKNKAAQDATNKKILKAIADLTALIQNPASDSAKTADKPAQKPDAKTAKLAPAEKLKAAEKAFKDKDYELAKTLFGDLVEAKHRPAYANYMLGEVQYAQQNYAAAIGFYKKSVDITQKGSHVPRLLYHTAISYDKTGDTASANKFYKALKQAYPDTAEAAASPDRK